MSQPRYALAGLAGDAVIRSLMASVRFETENEPEPGLRINGKPLLGLCWHGHLLVFAFRQRGAGLATLISQSIDLGSSITDAMRVYSDDMRHKRRSRAEEKAYALPAKLSVPMMVCIFPVSKDGEYIARVVQRWGYTVLRGSSSRGGSGALRSMVRVLRDGQSLAVTPDGPRGPRRKLKPGSLLAARMSGVPVLPTAAAATRAWWLGGWDRFLVPQPFARVRLVYGEPRTIPRDADDIELERIGGEIETEMNALTERAERALGVHGERRE